MTDGRSAMYDDAETEYYRRVRSEAELLGLDKEETNEYIKRQEVFHQRRVSECEEKLSAKISVMETVLDELRYYRNLVTNLVERNKAL